MYSQIIEFRGSYLSWLSCLSYLLLKKGIDLRLGDILSMRPIPVEGPSKEDMFKISRNLGFELTPIKVTPYSLRHAIEKGEIIATLSSKYTFIIKRIYRNNFIAALPGLGENISLDIIELNNISTANLVFHKGMEYAIKRNFYQQRLWLIPWLPCYHSLYNRQEIMLIEAELRNNITSAYVNPHMSSLSPEGLKNAHLSLNPEMKKYYGRYREINLRRDGHFIHHDRISYAIDELFHKIYKFKYTSKPELEIFSAKLFCDFLSIHPFLNGNRRIAMALISRFLKDHEADISWQRIGLSEVYYWTRIASRGKINCMIQGFRREIFYSNENEIDYPGQFLKPLSPD